MLTKFVVPKTKAELLRSLQAGKFRSFDVFEGEGLVRLPAKDKLAREGATVIVLRR